jgi:hypothetical protein
VDLSEEQQAIANTFAKVFEDLKDHMELIALIGESLKHAHERLDNLERPLVLLPR